MRSVFVADERVAIGSDIVDTLTSAGYHVTATIEDPAVDAVVVALRDGAASLPDCVRGQHASAIPVVVLGRCPSIEVALQSAIDGAVRWVEPLELVPALDAVLADDAPAVGEMRRQARVAALEAFARAQAESRLALSDDRCRVHLTRLEHGPVRSTAPAGAAMSVRFNGCTAHQRELLSLIAREGSVTKAAIALGASRSTVYASLRRIAHRVGMRDSSELLRHLISSS